MLGRFVILIVAMKLTKSEGDLTDDPVISAVDGDAPNDQTNSSQQGRRVDKPYTHLRCFNTIVLSCQFADKEIA